MNEWHYSVSRINGIHRIINGISRLLINSITQLSDGITRPINGRGARPGAKGPPREVGMGGFGEAAVPRPWPGRPAID